MKEVKKYLTVMMTIFMIASMWPAAVYASANEGDVAEEIWDAEEAAPMPDLEEEDGPESIEPMTDASEPEMDAIIPEDPPGLDTGESSETTYAVENEVPEDIVGANIQVGDGVTASLSSTGLLIFSSHGGTLWKDWIIDSGFQRDKIKSIHASGPLYLPADSSFIFYGLDNLTELDLSRFNTSRVKNMGLMFGSCESLTDLDLSGFNTSNVTNMSSMFSGCYSLTNLDLTGFNTSKVTDMDSIFVDCTSLTSLDLSSFNTSNVTNMQCMFRDCNSLTSLDVSNFDTSKAMYMAYMFFGCSKLKRLDLSNFKTSNVTNIGGMFYGCTSLTNLDLTSLDTSKVERMGHLFKNCSNLTTLDLSSFDTSKRTDQDKMFEGCKKLEIIRTPKKNSKSGIGLPLTMYDSAGKKYTALPVLSKSIVLARTQQAAKDYEKTHKRFSDVLDPLHPYFKAIYWAANAGITKGYSDGTFGINRNCTRGEMMMFLWRYAGTPEPKAVSKSPFKDVPKTHTFYKAILWGSQKGITKGYSDGTFGINRNVSRGECMMFLWRLKGKPEPKAVSVSPFKDVPKTHTFYKAILWGYQKKVTTGYTSGDKKGTFGINENCTRGQIVTFLYRAGTL